MGFKTKKDKVTDLIQEQRKYSVHPGGRRGLELSFMLRDKTQDFQSSTSTGMFQIPLFSIRQNLSLLLLLLQQCVSSFCS